MTEANTDLDSICGAALGMRFPRATTALIEFTGTVTREHKRALAPLSSTSLPAATAAESKPVAFVPSREAIDSRLDLLRENEYVLPVEGRYWKSINDYFAGKEPHYKGEIGREKASEFGLYNSKTAPIRVYADCVAFPRVEEKKE